MTKSANETEAKANDEARLERPREQVDRAAAEHERRVNDAISIVADIFRHWETALHRSSAHFDAATQYAMNDKSLFMMGLSPFDSDAGHVHVSFSTTTRIDGTIALRHGIGTRASVITRPIKTWPVKGFNKGEAWGAVHSIIKSYFPPGSP